MPLSAGIKNGRYQIVSMDLPFQMQKRLEALGLLQGTALQILNTKDHGVMIIKFRGSRFALGRHITQNIEVNPL